MYICVNIHEKLALNRFFVKPLANCLILFSDGQLFVVVDPDLIILLAS